MGILRFREVFLGEPFRGAFWGSLLKEPIGGAFFRGAFWESLWGSLLGEPFGRAFWVSLSGSLLGSLQRDPFKEPLGDHCSKLDLIFLYPS